MQPNHSKENNIDAEKIFSVSEYIGLLNKKLGACGARIIGEVSGVQMSAKGHVYFSLKDEKDGALINCIIWKSRYAVYGVELKEGVKIIASGYPEIYAPSGRISFISETIELAGEGALKKAYEKLKKKLTEEGLFEERRKRPIPSYPEKIGVVTSRQGAVLADFLNNLGKFGFKIKMIDSRVEGQQAVADLLLSIKSFQKQDIDALVIIRGGGSLESHMAFNNEALVRAIVDFPVPVIAGIGHHKDIPLLALAADIMVSTPTAAANLLSQSWEQAALLLQRYERDVVAGYEKELASARSLLDRSLEHVREMRDLIFNKCQELEIRLKISFEKFDYTLQKVKINLQGLWDKSIIAGFKSLLGAAGQRIEYAQKIISLNNPERQLLLGYSIARCRGKIIKSVRDARAGDDIDVQVADGVIASEVKHINKIKKSKNG